MYHALFRSNFFIYSFLALVHLVGPDLSAYEFDKLDVITNQNVFLYNDLDQQIDYLIQVFDTLKECGIDIIAHPEIFDSAYSLIKENGIDISDNEFIEIKEYVLNLYTEKENPIFPFHSPKLPSQKQPEYSKGFLSGFIQVLAGSILCIIPHPFTLAIGSGLVVSGIQTFVSDAAENQSKNTNNMNDQYEFPVVGKGPIPYKKKK